MEEEKRVVVVTGGTGGIGLYSALGVAKEGAHVVITGRDIDRGEQAKKRIIEESGNNDVTFFVGDLSSIEGVRTLAEILCERFLSIDVLVNNAGYLGNKEQKSKDNLELHFAVNVLAPWLLSRLILPRLKKAKNARILNITGGDKPAAIDTDNLQAEKGFKGLMTYTHSKSIMEAMSISLAREFEKEGVDVNIVFPGRASTDMTRSLSIGGLPGPMKLMFPFFRLFFREDGGKSAKKAARSTIWAVNSTDLEGVRGCYFDAETNKQSLHATAYDVHNQKIIVDLLVSVCSSAGIET